MSPAAVRLRREAARIGKFSLTGVANTAVDMATFSLLAFAVGLAPALANGLAGFVRLPYSAGGRIRA